ncbi:MAG: hypothetical protein IJD60_08250 [Clostridia bacterium]|nr:hypothetical protein [Clostridia bacterium]
MKTNLHFAGGETSFRRKAKHHFAARQNITLPRGRISLRRRRMMSACGAMRKQTFISPEAKHHFAVRQNIIPPKAEHHFAEGKTSLRRKAEHHPVLFRLIE